MVFEFTLTLLAGIAFGFFLGRRQDRLATRPIGLQEPGEKTVVGDPDIPHTSPLASVRLQRLTTALDATIPPEVLETSSYLARHYLGTGQMPGALLDLMTLAVQRALAHDARAVAREDVLATMTQLTGMPQQVLDDRERVDLAALRAFFSSRVIGQDEAVSAVVDRIAMLKAG